MKSLKFKPGNLITHNPTKSRWLVISSKRLYPKEDLPESPYKMQIVGLCILVGLKPRYWKINEIDTWALTKQDLFESDCVWSIINGV
jgi:hypothetical protein